ncbi:MAG: sulfite exporter TauE/SafE family protein, partial [Bacteroidota bacterium]
MPEFLAHFDLSNWEWGLVIACAMMVGMSKVGVQGVYNLVVPLMALIFGGKPSTGILLPILIMAD